MVLRRERHCFKVFIAPVQKEFVKEIKQLDL